MSRYNNTDVYVTSEGKRYLGTTKYPKIPLSLSDIYVYATQGDRFDILAQQFYNDSSLWWIISIANPQLPQNSLYITPGTQIRVPFNPADIIQRYRSLNSL